MANCICGVVVSFLLLSQSAMDVLPTQQPPTAVEKLFADFDPQKDPLYAKTIREWEQNGIVYRYVTFHIGTFKEKPARMAAFYAFPKAGTKLPGLLHLHGGGQRAFLHEVEFYAKKGYACLSVNWGGREMEDAKPGEPNTDWGAVDPTQNNVAGYFNLKPGEKYLDPVDSPRNNHWYLLTLGARRGLTFLEQQPEVAADKLGVYGHSMGGNLTIYVAGTDRRIKAAAPSVGGSGFRTEPWPLLPQARKQQPNGDVELFRQTLDFAAYATQIKAPTLWLSSTNDFHGIMDDMVRTGQLIRADVAYSFTPHMNHRFTPEFAVARPLWFDRKLKFDYLFPETPKSRLALANRDGIPVFWVMPDDKGPELQTIERVRVLYSFDPDPRARFWRTVDAKQEGKDWFAQLPLMHLDQPLFAFANVYYKLAQPQPVPFAQPTSRLAISSLLHTATPQDLRQASVKATDRPEKLIDDFQHDWQDWYSLSPENPHHWEYSTRKLSDPKWQGQPQQTLTLELKSAEENELIIILTENFFRDYRGKMQEFVAVVKLTGGEKSQTVRLSPSDFTNANGEALASWTQLDLLSFRPYFERGNKLLGSKQWLGTQPVFSSLRWEGD